MTPWTSAHQASLSSTVSPSFLRFVSIESVMPSNHLILCCPLLLLPPVFSSQRVFSCESALHIRWPKHWSFSSISPSNEHPGLISFRMDWLDLHAVQGTLKGLLQHHSSEASVLWLSLTLIGSSVPRVDDGLGGGWNHIRPPKVGDGRSVGSPPPCLPAGPHASCSSRLHGGPLWLSLLWVLSMSLIRQRPRLPALRTELWVSVSIVSPSPSLERRGCIASGIYISSSPQLHPYALKVPQTFP